MQGTFDVHPDCDEEILFILLITMSVCLSACLSVCLPVCVYPSVFVLPLCFLVKA